jgi:hypothetical protein
MIRNLILQCFQIVGACFTLFSLLAYVGLKHGDSIPMTKSARKEWEENRSDPGAKARDTYVVHCFLIMWFYIGVALFSFIAPKIVSVVWTAAFGVKP